MDINIAKTKEFYKTYTPCQCGDCRMYYAILKKRYPNLYKCLLDLGIDPLKPYDLITSHPVQYEVKFLSCQYVLFGTVDDFKTEIDGLTIKKESAHSELITSDKYFVISFGPINIKNYRYDSRHLTKEEKTRCILHVLDKYDPICLKNIAPKDEYYIEAKLLEEEFTKRRFHIGFYKQVHQVFNKQFGVDLDLSLCKNIANEIIHIFVNEMDIKYYSDNLILKDKYSFTNDEHVLTIHEGFVVKSKTDRFTYINDKKYFEIEDNDLLDEYINFVTNDNVVYVQYKHKHHISLFKGLYTYFKIIKKEKFDFDKLHHKNDIELIFDNKSILYKK